LRAEALRNNWFLLRADIFDRIMQHAGVRIPMHRGHLLRFDRGQATDLMAATIPI
jgi:hypothetical protein